MSLAPELKIIAPLREWEMYSRDEEIEYAKDNNIQIDTTKKSPYSLDKKYLGHEHRVRCIGRSVERAA